VLYQYFQDPPDCSFMFLFHSHKNQNVVQVHYYNPFGYEGSEDVVHHSLKGSSVMLLENFLWKCSMGYILYPWILLLESTLETSYKPQT